MQAVKGIPVFLVEITAAVEQEILRPVRWGLLVPHNFLRMPEPLARQDPVLGWEMVWMAAA